MLAILEYIGKRVGARNAFAIFLTIVVVLLTVFYFQAPVAKTAVPVFIVGAVVTIPLLLLWDHMTSVGVQQLTLFSLLILGLASYLIVAWTLLATGAVESAANVAELQKAGLQLFLPYLGIAIGGVFGVQRLTVTRVDLQTFFIAVAVLVLWDALAIGNIWAMRAVALASAASADAAGDVPADGFADIWAFEDALGFVNNLMPLLAFLPAAAIGFYFGAQPGKPGPGTETTPVKAEP